MTGPEFVLHAQLERDTFFIVELPLCRTLLMNNSLFPWIILVPRVADAREIFDLPLPDRHLLMDEISLASSVMRDLFTPDKLNVAALGNQVPQLHLHVIARYINDSAWPNPVWGKGSAPYGNPQEITQRLAGAFASYARAF